MQGGEGAAEHEPRHRRRADERDSTTGETPVVSSLTGSVPVQPGRSRGHGRAHAKVILFGEHAVVHGQPAIAFPMKQVSLNATATRVDGPLSLTADIFDGPLTKAPAKLAPLVTTIEATLDLLQLRLEGVHVAVSGDIPLERGLGSSAAGAAAIVSALADLSGQPLDDHSRYELVQAGERVAHGSPSGLDAYTVVGAKPIWFQAGRIQPITVRLGAPLVVADSGCPGDTRSAVAAVGDLRRANPALAAEHFERIRRHTVAARENLARDERVELGRRMTAVHDTLRSLSVSSPELDHLVEAALRADALGAKLTGGGRGGCIVALARDEAHGEQLARALSEAGAQRTWIMPPRELQEQ